MDYGRDWGLGKRCVVWYNHHVGASFCEEVVGCEI